MVYQVDGNQSDNSSFDNTTVSHSTNDRNAPFVFTVLLTIVGLIGNSHALVINVKRFRSKKKQEDVYLIFVLNLAIHDMFTSTIILPMEAVDTAHTSTPYSDGVCKLLRYLQFAIHISSVLHITLISIYCWRQFYYPLSRQIDKTFAIIFCLVFNCIAAAFAVIAIFFSGVENIIIDGVINKFCMIGESHEHTSFLRIAMIIMSTGFVVCLFIICMCYIALIVNKWQKGRLGTTTSVSNEEKLLKKLTAILIIITILFVIAYIHFLILGIIKVIDKNIQHSLRGASDAAHSIFFRFPFLNTVVNPFIYGLMDNNFRRLFLHIYPCLKNLRTQDVEMNSSISIE